jgi:hypothetical protein
MRTSILALLLTIISTHGSFAQDAAIVQEIKDLS